MGCLKGVIQIYQMVLVNYINIGQVIGLCFGDVILNFLLFFYIVGVNLYILFVLMSGGFVYVLLGFEFGFMFKLIDQGMLDVFIGVLVCYCGFVLYGDFEKIDFICF